MPSATPHPVTAFEGANTLGIRYEDRTLCITCSITVDDSDESYLLEKDVVTDASCALCSQQI